MGEADLENLYRAQGATLWRAVVAFTGDREVASDAVAEAFAQALAHADAIRDPGAWVWRSAFKIAAGDLNQRGRLPSSPPANPGYELPEPIDHVIEALRLISPNQRMAVVLHDFADRPTDEIASTMGVTRATVHVHLSQGRRRLRKLLEDEDA